MPTQTETPTPTLSDDDVLALYRLAHPRARRTRSTAIIHSGGRRTIYDCVCGSTISRATDWPVTRRVVEWRAEHDGCLRRLVARLDLPTDWPERVATWRAGRLRAIIASFRPVDDYGQDEADGAACRAMASALAAARRP